MEIAKRIISDLKPGTKFKREIINCPLQNNNDPQCHEICTVEKIDLNKIVYRIDSLSPENDFNKRECDIFVIEKSGIVMGKLKPDRLFKIEVINPVPLVNINNSQSQSPPSQQDHEANEEKNDINHETVKKALNVATDPEHQKKGVDLLKNDYEGNIIRVGYNDYIIYLHGLEKFFKTKYIEDFKDLNTYKEVTVDLVWKSEDRRKRTVHGIFTEINRVLHDNRNGKTIDDYIKKSNITAPERKQLCLAYVSEPYLKGLKWSQSERNIAITEKGGFIQEYAYSKQGCVGVYGHDMPFSEYEILNIWKSGGVDTFLKQQEKMSKEGNPMRVDDQLPFVIYINYEQKLDDIKEQNKTLRNILLTLRSNHYDIDSFLQYVPLTIVEFLIQILNKFFSFDCVKKKILS